MKCEARRLHVLHAYSVFLTTVKQQCPQVGGMGQEINPTRNLHLQENPDGYPAKYDSFTIISVHGDGPIFVHLGCGWL